MNKTEFINVLSKELEYSIDKCTIINDVLENHFLIGKNNKEKMVSELIDKLEIDQEEANRIYEVAMKIVSTGIKDKLKHPFKSQD